MSAASAVSTTRRTAWPGMRRKTTTPMGAEKPPPDAPLEPWQARHSPLYWDESVGLSRLPERELEAAAACRDTVLDKIRERRGHVEEKEREKEDVEDVEDSLNVDEMSELFSCVEQEETSGVDFSVFIQDEDVINVEEISQLFSCQESSKEITVASPVDVVDTKELETQHKSLDLFDSFDGVAVSHEEDEVSALSDVENVDILSEIFSATLEDKNAVEPAPAASTPTFSRADREDATNVDLVADLFASLEASSGASQDEVADRLTTRDWIDALEVDNVASLFADLEQTEMMQMKTVVPAAPVKVDSRIFVPTFSVRIDGLRSERPAVGPNSNLLVGPPGVLLAGPPPPTRNDGVDHRKPKRTRPSAAKPPPQDMSISDTRRASAAKRQRVKGRFVSDTHTFVSITALQK
uniref:CCT domain-containing protein n=1 Tax=Phytophthora ramorum TaxID=164328 RepID=H3GEU3_PHYRM